MECHAEISSAVVTPVKWRRFGKADMGDQNKQSIYNIYNLLKDIFEQPHHVANINFHRTQGITAKMCDVHHIMVQRICSEAFSSLPDSKKTCRRKQ
jgi:hypothetical protein